MIEWKEKNMFRFKILCIAHIFQLKFLWTLHIAAYFQ